MTKILLAVIIFIGSFTATYATCSTPASVTISPATQSVCEGSSLTITADIVLSTPPTGVIQYTWYKGNSSTGTIVSGPSTTYSDLTITEAATTDAGTYTLHVEDYTGPSSCYKEASVLVDVNPVVIPNVTITSTETTVCGGGSTTFTAIPTNGGTPTYRWFKQGEFVGTGSTFISTGFQYGAATAYSVEMTSTEACASLTKVSSNAGGLTVNGIWGGIIESDQIICYNAVPAAILEFVAPGGFVQGSTAKYRWEISETGIDEWTIIPGQDLAIYVPGPAFTKDAYIRRVVTDPLAPAPCNTAASNIIHITVRPQLTAGVITGDESLCARAVQSTIMQSAAPTGGTGIYTYQWQSRIYDMFLNIPGATNLTYTPSPSNYTTDFQRVVTSGTCGIAKSNVVIKTISNPETMTVFLDSPGQTCAGSTMVLTASTYTAGLGTLSYEWNIGGTSVVTNTPTYSFITAIGDNAKTVKVIVSTSVCNDGPVTSNPVTLDIITENVTPTVSIQGLNANCAGLICTLNSTSITGSGGNPTFQWYVIPQGSTTPVTVGTGSTILQSPSFQNGDQVYLELTSSLVGCMTGTNPYRSNIITMDIKPIPWPTINEGDQTICEGSSTTFTATVGSGTRLQWYRYTPDMISYQDAIIPGATNSTYIATEEGYYALHEDNGICNSMSARVILTIDPCGSFSTRISGPNPITPGQQNAVYSVFDQPGFSYQWTVTGGTISSGQNTNSVMVDWDEPNTFARTTATTYSISVVEKNALNQTKKTKLTVNTLTTGTVQSQAQSGIKLFPNPTAGSFSIEMPESGTEVSYQILDVTGLSVASGTFISTGDDQKIETNFDAGMYQVILKYDTVVTCLRLSKVQ